MCYYVIQAKEGITILTAIKKLVSDGSIAWTRHVFFRMRSRCISSDDVLTCICLGEAIENYQDDIPYPSFLISGKDKAGDPLHVVVAYDGRCAYIITTYRPDNDTFEQDLKTRKGR